MLNRFAFPVVATLALLLPASVAAQQEPDEGAPQGRYLLGSALSVTPAVVVVLGRDSNAIRTDSGEAASEYYIVPQIEGWLGRGRTRLNFANAVEVSRQTTESTTNSGTLNHYHVGRLDLGGGGRLALQALASYRDHYAPPTDFVGFERGLKSRRVEQEYGLNGDFRPGGRILFRGNATRTTLRYDADARFQGVSLEQNLNRNTTIFGGDALVTLTPLSSLAVTASMFRDRFLFAPDRDGDGIRMSLGGQFSPRALLSGRADAGYLSYRNKQTGTRFSGPAYNVGLSLAKAPIFLDISGRRAIEFSFDPGRGFFVSNSLEVFSSVAPVSGWQLFGRVSARRMTPRGILAELEPSRIIRGYKVGLARELRSQSRIGVDVEGYETQGLGGFKGVRTTLFLTYGSTRLQRLDRPLPGGF